MSMRYPAGFIRPGFDPLKNPDAPTGVSASGGDELASVSFTPPSNVGGSAISAYYAVSNPGQITASAASSPVSVTGLTNGTSYTFAVWALNTYGPGPFSAASGSVSPAAPIAFFAGGDTGPGGLTSNVNRVVISTTGNASNFANLTAGTVGVLAFGSSTKSFAAGGYSSFYVGTITTTTFASGGTYTSFGNIAGGITSLRGTGLSNSTRGLICGGFNNGTATNSMRYVTMSSAGDGTDFGDMILSTADLGGCASPTRGVLSGGSNGNVNTIQFITIDSAGNASDFGDLTQNTGNGTVSFSSSTRAIFGGGWAGTIGYDVRRIDTKLIASAGNATDFGELFTSELNSSSGASSQTRGLWGGGIESSKINVIQYITIESGGNALDFGDLTAATESPAGSSNAHGGLQ